MGTRHAQYVINREGEEKVAQYGQWDGYPSEDSYLGETLEEAKENLI